MKDLPLKNRRKKDYNVGVSGSGFPFFDSEQLVIAGMV